jgi:flagellar hook assembly protein FlgD
VVSIYNSAGELVRHLYAGASQNLAGGFSLDATALAPGGPGIKVNLGGQIQGGGESLVWQGTNDNGQFVSGGTYTILMTSTDSFGSVRTWSEAVTVTPQGSTQSLGIYDSSGELVVQLSLASLGQGTKVSGLSLPNPPGGAFVIAGGPGAGVPLLLQLASGGVSTLTWNGLNSGGHLAASGSYTVQLVDLVSGGSGGIVTSKNFQVLQAPSSSGEPLLQVGPNPLGPNDRQWVLAYGSLAAGMSASVKLYNIAGELIALGEDASGSGRIFLQPGNCSAGIYIAVFETWQGGTLMSRHQKHLAVQR